MECNKDCFNCIYDDCVIDVNIEEKPKAVNTDSYYWRHRAERMAYQREYERRKHGYKPKVEKPKKTEEEIKERRRKIAREFYKNNRESRIEYSRNYYKAHREYFLKKSRERYRKLCEERG